MILMCTCPFVWFTDADVEIVGDDICSKCRLPIPQDEVPLLLFRERSPTDVDIARFHDKCARELMAAGIIQLVPKK